MKNVKIIKRQGDAALIQMGYERKIVPIIALNGNMCDDMVWEAGLPYGVPWEEAATGKATPEQIAFELYKVGIYTEEDLERRPNAVIAAIQSVYGIDLAALRRLAKKYRGG